MFSTSTVLITGVGADGQVGEVVASAFASLGASLVLVDRRPERAEARAAALSRDGRTARGYPCDLTNTAAVATLAERVRQDHGGALHALVHMAGGFAMSGPVAESADDVWDRQLAINLRTAYVTARAFLPLLRQGRGSIVFFASQAALPGASVAGMAAYAAAKSGVVALTRAIAAEERESGVRANALAPAAIRTAANVNAMGPDARFVEREQVADAVVFLCSPRSSAVSGIVLPLE